MYQAARRTSTDQNFTGHLSYPCHKKGITNVTHAEGSQLTTTKQPNKTQQPNNPTTNQQQHDTTINNNTTQQSTTK